MIKFILPYVFLIIVFFLTDLLSYKYIRKIDKKERKKLDKEELDHVKKMIEKYKELDNIKAYQIEQEKEDIE